MTVRAKFKVGTKTPGSPCSITMWPVVDGSEENKAFFASTPSGKIELSILNDLAAAQLLVGEEYYVDFTPAKTDAGLAYDLAARREAVAEAAKQGFKS